MGMVMRPLALIRRALIGLLGTALGMGVLVIAAHADELPATQTARPIESSIVIHDADETLQQYCRTESDGRLWLELPGGARFELITTTDDPAIINKGDGAFHAFESREIQSAISQVRYAVSRLSVHIYVLPYPRRGGLESAAGPGLILLSPGVRPLSVQHQHAELVHELGHVVQYALMPDADRDAWQRYRDLRGIDDEQVYSGASAHSNRPHEIFAEDFRALFGGADANYSGTIENATIGYPTGVQGLSNFILGLAEDSTRTIAMSVWPNPSRGTMTFSRSGSARSILDVFDAQGRRVATLAPAAGALGVRWTWDGRDAAGSRVGPGILFARPREAGAGTVRVTLLP